MIKKRLHITEIKYKVGDNQFSEKFFGVTNGRTALAQVQERYKGQEVKVMAFGQYTKDYEIDENDLIKHGKELIESEEIE